MNGLTASDTATPARLPGVARALPLVALTLSDRCNSRCVSCDYWRHGTTDMKLATVERLLPDLERLGTQVVLLTGGEPLVNAEWPAIAAVLRERGLKLWLLTSGLSLAKHAARVAGLFDTVTVSLDGADASTYAAIRGVDAFEKVCEGISACARLGVPVSVRVTLQRANYRQLSRFVDVARAQGAREVSFLAVDVANPHAFARQDDYASDLALRREDLAPFAQAIEQLEHTHAEALRTRFIAESLVKLRRLHTYFSAVLGLSAYPPVRCNAPEFSAVVGAAGELNPCFFIRGEGLPRVPAEAPLAAALGSVPFELLRQEIRAGKRPECTACVCPLWRPQAASAEHFLHRAGTALQK